MRCSLCGSATRPWHEPRDFIVAVQQLLWKVHCALKLGSTARAEDWNKAVSGSKLQLRESSNRRDENRQNAWFIALPLYRSSFCSCRESFNHIYIYTYIYIYVYMYICPLRRLLEERGILQSMHILFNPEIACFLQAI